MKQVLQEEQTKLVTYMFGLGGTAGFTLNCLNETDLIDELQDPLESEERRHQLDAT